MKSIKPYVTGVLAGVSLALSCISSHAYVGPTNLFLYNFDNTNSAEASLFGNWFGGDYVTNTWDPLDASNNPNSGSLLLEVNYNHDQYVLMDGYTPSYSGLPIAGIVSFTNLQYDVIYYSGTWPQIRTNVSPEDFGDARVGSRSSSYGQDWYFYYQVPATNSLGQQNTNWVHISANLSNVGTLFSDLQSSGLINTMFAQDDANYGNNVLSGTQYINYDNIQYNGWVAPVPPPKLSILKTTPDLLLFGGIGVYGRSEVQISTNYLNDGWIPPGTSYPVSYSFTVANNATTPGNLDTHLTFLPSVDAPEGDTAADYINGWCLWLQIISGGGTNTSCVVNFSWKTNDTGCNPNSVHTNGVGGAYDGGVALYFTNSVRAGTWTLTWNSDVSGSITCPAGSQNSLGVNPIPFNLSTVTLSSNTFGTNFGSWLAGNNIAPALTSAGADANFDNPIYIRFGIQNYGNAGNAPNGDPWTSISVSGTAGTNFTVDFTHQGFNTNTPPSGLDPNLWDLTSSDGGATVTIQVPTNAPYWVNWNTPDAGWNNLCTATNLNGPWKLVSYYNGYADGTNASGEYVIGTQTAHNGVKWNLMLPQYLPTANGLSNNPTPPTYPYNLSPDAFFRLTTDTNTPPL